MKAIDALLLGKVDAPGEAAQYPELVVREQGLELPRVHVVGATGTGENGLGPAPFDELVELVQSNQHSGCA